MLEALMDVAPRPAVAESGLARISKLLGRLPKDSSDKTVETNLALISQMAERAPLAALLREILRSPELLADVASRSYRHINLFDKIVLVGDNAIDGYRLTLHMWCPPYAAEEHRQELIHEHRFSFWSTIVAGTLVSEVFERGETGVEYKRFRYIPEVGRSVKFLDFYEYCGPARLSSAGLTRHRAGKSYYLSSVAIHQILLPETELTCTLVLRGPRQSECTYVYNTAYPTEENAFDNVMFTPGQLRIRLERLLRVIDADPARPRLGE